MTSQIKISYQQDGRKQERLFEFSPRSTSRLAVEQVCSLLTIAEDWTLAMYSRKHGGWIHDETRLGDITFKGSKTLELRTKTPSYFEARPSTALGPSKPSLRDSTILRGTSSPIDHHRLFNFFRTTDDQFVSKFQNGSIYLSLLIIGSDNKILLSPSGLPPTVLISTVGGLANYYNFDSDSSDFAWMFKTTLDWAAATDPSSIRARDERNRTSGAASPEMRARSPTSMMGSSTGSPSLSPPTSRGSFARSKRGSISSTTGPTVTSNCNNSSSNISNGVSAKLTATSSVSVDRSSVISDYTMRHASSFYEYVDRKRDYRGENALRQEYVAAAEELQRKLGCPPIELLFDRVVDLPLVGAKTLMAIQYARGYDAKDQIAPELMQLGTFRWRHIDSVSNSVYTRREEVWSQLTNYYDNVRGLYVGLYYTESTMSGLQILVPRHRRTFIPIMKLRDEADLSPEEWEWLRSTASMDISQLAKDCDVSKDDPMHHLKVEFAHSTSKLSRLTQLKWNPSDMYTLDTLHVVMQKTRPSMTSRSRASSLPQSRRMSHDSQFSSPAPLPFTNMELPIKLGQAAAPSPLHRSMVAMDQDPAWQHCIIDSEASKSFRVILFIKPTRHATQPQEIYNRQLFELCPFPIFDALHHSVFNTATYHHLRRTMLQLTNDIVDLEIELEQELEQELAVQQRETSRSKGRMGDDLDADWEKDEENLIGSLLIDQLGIKDESAPLHPLSLTHQHPRLRSSFIGDDAIRGTGGLSKRSSSTSLQEIFDRSAPAVSSAISLVSMLSSYGNETVNSAIPIVQEETGAQADRSRSRMSMTEFETGGAESRAGSRRGSHTSQRDLLRVKERAYRARGGGDEDNMTMSFMDMIQDLDPITSEAVLSASLNNISRISIQSSESSSSSSSDDDNDSNGSNYLSRFHHHQEKRRSSLGLPRKVESRPSLPPLPSLPRHRRSYSLVQTADARLSPVPVPGNISNQSSNHDHSNGNNMGLSSGSTSSSTITTRTARSRTTSHSSYNHVQPQYYYHHHHHQHQQPVYRNRYLTSKNYPHYLSDIQQQHQQPHQQHQEQHQHHLRHHHHYHNNNSFTYMNPDPDDGHSTIFNDNSELARLERQQQEVQEQWRMVSWTRQLNEWDHARMLKSQGDLLGMGMNMDMNLKFDTDVSIGGVESLDDLEAELVTQNGIPPSPPKSTSLTSLQSSAEV